MRTWIFQGNPDLYAVDGGFATHPTEFAWPVPKNIAHIKAGDRVWIWKANSDRRGLAGIIAETLIASIIDPCMDKPDTLHCERAELSIRHQVLPKALLRVRGSVSYLMSLRRTYIQQDPILGGQFISDVEAAATFPITSDQASRLSMLWCHHGSAWTRNEALAVLWAYVTIGNGSHSRRLGSPIAKVALLTGKWIGDVHGKVLSLGHLETKIGRLAEREVESVFERVLAEFFDTDTGRLQRDRIEQEFSRVWPDPVTEMSALDVKAQREAVELAARTLEDSDIDDLLASYHRSRHNASGFPPVTTSTAEVYQRCPLVVAICRKRAGYHCEVPGCDHASFTNLQGNPYCEVHHIVPLAEGGEDTIDNVACVCPTHHREVHFGMRRDEITRALKQIRAGGASNGDLLTGVPDGFTTKI